MDALALATALVAALVAVTAVLITTARAADRDVDERRHRDELEALRRVHRRTVGDEAAQ